ncbi:3'-5' exonuclease [Bacteriovorax sp. DB6_IX]|nr:3'-5' exonuclease [Bacteriovorax sp. DB6_IX]
MCEFPYTVHMTQKRISKEAINELPLYKLENDIELIIAPEQMAKAIEELRKAPVLGFDTETRPSFSKGESYSVSLLQLSTESKNYLFRINQVPFNQELAAILEDENIKKVGVAIHDDIKHLNRIRKFKAKAFIDVADLAKEKGIITLGLRSLAGLLLDKRISKKAKLSNWEQPTLTPAQINYAATDSEVSLKLFQALR